MREGFFSDTEVVGKAPLSLVPKCGACGLYKLCNSPKMEWSGKGRLSILIVGEAPGEEEDEKGKQFVGKTGRHLEQTLERVGIDMRRDCWLTNAIICRPPKNKFPPKALGYCRPNLNRAIQELDPSTIILLGNKALLSFVEPRWKEDPGGINKWAGVQIPSREPNAWVCPTWHPSWLLRLKNEAADIWFERHLRAAVKLEGRPWKKPPDYAKQVRIVLDPKEAARAVHIIKGLGRPFAFDYETTTLKPDGPHAQIYTCAVSDGQVTTAFPWHGEVVTAMRELLRSDVPKIAANMKFEDRWTRKEFGFPVRRWLFDTMVASHWLDQRAGITSLKFQAYTRFGQPDYNSHIKPYFKSKGGSNKPNRIKELELRDVLLYNGLDALLEYKLARMQMAEGKVPNPWKE